MSLSAWILLALTFGFIVAKRLPSAQAGGS